MAVLAGMFQSVFLKEFDGGLVFTSWITALFASLMQLGGVLSGLVCRIYGCRMAVMSGGVFLTLGLLLSSLTGSPATLLLTFGISGGLGLGLIFSANIVAVNLSFVRYRPLATGVVFAGGGVGMMGMPLLCQYLLDTYRWRMSLVILAAMSAQILVVGSTLFPADARAAGIGSECRRVWKPCRCRRRHKRGHSETDVITRDKQTSRTSISRGTTSLDTDASEHLVEKSENTWDKKQNKELDTGTVEEHSRLLVPSHDSVPCTPPNQAHDDAKIKDDATENVAMLLQNPESNTNFDPEIQECSETSTCSRYCTAITNPSLVLIYLEMCLYNAAIGIVLIHFVNFCLERGTDGSSVSVGFSAHGLGLAVGRILVGIMGQDRSIDPLVVFVGLAFVTALLMLITPLIAATSTIQIIDMAFLGMYSASGYSVLPEITIHCASLDTLSEAFGIESLSGGIG
nr:hypothetical protein BaRGS_000717 [Batillaria attramentaria]